MKYQKREISSYKLHMIKTDKFKTIFFKFIFRDELKKEDITKRNLLFDMLTSSSFKYPSERLMNIEKQNLYDLGLFCHNRRIGYHISSEICFSILNPNFTEKVMLEKAIEFMKEIIFYPNIKDNKFNKEFFNVSKNIIRRDIISKKEYSKYDSLSRMKEIMDASNPFSFNMDGYLTDLELITEESLADYYKQVLNNSLIDIYVVGDFDFYEMEKLIKENMQFKSIKKDKMEMIKEYNVSKRVKKLYEESDFNQTRLVLGLGFKKLTEKEKKYAMLIYNTILGNSPESKLFKNIRETKSLTYDINSAYSKNDNILIITTGLNVNNVDLAIKSIKEEIKNMIKGQFSNKEINAAKKLIISSLKDLEDFQGAICEYYFSMEYLKTDTLKKTIEEIKKVSKEDICKVASKVKLDTIYVLKEKEHEKN